MSTKFISSAIFMLYFLSCCCHPSPRCLLISFDGFRWDYLTKTDTPNFHKIIENGVIAKRGLINAFITKTFPNHYSIVTGLYEESHGVVGNTMYDPVYKEVFKISNDKQVTESKWFDNGGEPIWVTNQKEGSGKRSGVLFWPGDGASVKGFLPYRYRLYNPEVKYEDRIEEVIKWFKDEYPINLGLLYFEEPDGAGHYFGPDSENMTAVIAKIDKLVGYLLKRLEENDMGDLNIIITSDHGMASTPETQIIDLDKYIDPLSYQIFSSNPIGSILPNEGKEDEIYRNLSNIHHLTVYKKENIPEQFHYKHNRRVQPILLVTDEGWSLRHNKSDVPKGNHGYNNSLPDMHPVFVAMGPAFQKGATVDTFHNVDIYPLMCHLMGLKPAPNNGSIENVRALLKGENGDFVFINYIAILLFIGLIGGIFSIGACRQQIFLRRNRQVQLRSLTVMPNTFQYPSRTSNGGHVPLLVNSETEDEF